MNKSVFFKSEEDTGIGLTSTSANTIANMAKEYIQSCEVILDNFCFYNTTVGLISSSENKIIQKGTSIIGNIPALLSTVSKAKSLIAWLREAIKAKEEMHKYLLMMSLTDYCNILNIQIPSKPIKAYVLTEEEYYNSLDIKERNRYYQLETEAAVLGKYIHPNGAYSEARKDLKDKVINPYKVIGQGRDALIYSYTPTIEVEAIDEQFYELQKEHREIQKQLNSMKFECEKAINESQIKADSEYSAAYSEYAEKLKVLEAQRVAYIKEQEVEIGKLRIRIPDSLIGIYQTISNLGK
jgi:hypothetical protein